MERERLAAGWELANFLGVVERRDVAPGAGDGDRVQQLEEVEVQRGENRLRRALLRWQLRPDIEGRLRPAEDLVDVPFRASFALRDSGSPS